MARWGISGAPVPAFVPFAAEITAACAAYPGGFPPCFLAAIKINETDGSHNPSEMQEGTWPGSDFLALPDGSGPDSNNPAGHGPFQLTAQWPSDWADPRASASYALRYFLAPAIQFFLDRVSGISGSPLVKCGAAAFNAGPGGAWAGYVDGSVDKYDTDGYGERAVLAYEALVEGKRPLNL